MKRWNRGRCRKPACSCGKLLAEDGKRGAAEGPRVFPRLAGSWDGGRGEPGTEPAGSGAPVWSQQRVSDQVASTLAQDWRAGECGHREAAALEGAAGARGAVGGACGAAGPHAGRVGGPVVGRAGSAGRHRDAVPVLHRRRDQLQKKVSRPPSRSGPISRGEGWGGVRSSRRQ